jgi:hypothetical protein
MIWRGTTTGDFTVRSAHHVEKDRLEATRGECSVQSELHSLWKKIWGMKVQNSLKYFFWRACQNILFARDNLHRRGMDLDTSYIFCKSEPETIFHVLWTCPSASDAWGSCEMKIQKCTTSGNSFVEVLEYLFDKFRPDA